MRRRIASALALGALAGLAGCATQTRRSESPSPYLNWTAPSGPTAEPSASDAALTRSPARPAGPISSWFSRVTGHPFPARSATPAAKAAPSGPIATFLAKSMAASSPRADAASSPAPAGAGTPGTTTPSPASAAGPAGTTTASRTGPAPGDEIPATALRPRYKPGSWLFRKLARPTPAAATASASAPNGSAGALSRYFPTNYGQRTVDAARLARASRPTMGGDRAGAGGPSFAGSPVEMTRNTVGAPEVEPPLLADGIPVRAYPRKPSLSLPAAEPSTPTGEQLTSHEAAPADPAPAPKPGGDLIDALSIGPDAGRPDPDDAPSDPEGRPTSATVELPVAPVAASDKPAGAIVPSPDPETGPIAEEAANPAPGADLISSLLAPPVMPSAPAEAEAATAPAESSRPEPRPTTTALPPSPALEPAVSPTRMVRRAEPIALPPPEFPATYHTESLRQVMREAPRSRPVSVEPAPHRPLLPRLSHLLWGHEDK